MEQAGVTRVWSGPRRNSAVRCVGADFRGPATVPTGSGGIRAAFDPVAQRPFPIRESRRGEGAGDSGRRALVLAEQCRVRRLAAAVLWRGRRDDGGKASRLCDGGRIRRRAGEAGPGRRCGRSGPSTCALRVAAGRQVFVLLRARFGQGVLLTGTGRGLCGGNGPLAGSGRGFITALLAKIPWAKSAASISSTFAGMSDAVRQFAKLCQPRLFGEVRERSWAGRPERWIARPWGRWATLSRGPRDVGKRQIAGDFGTTDRDLRPAMLRLGLASDHRVPSAVMGDG